MLNKTKNAVVLTLLAAASYVATPALAQSPVRVGIKGGFNASTLYYDNPTNRKESTGFHAGLFAQVPVNSLFAIQPELLYTQKGATADFTAFGSSGRNTFNLDYLELPVLATVKLGPTVELQAGPYVGYLVGSNTRSDNQLFSVESRLDRNQFNKVDYGLAGGLNVYLGKALVGLRYAQGLQNVANTNESRAFLGNAKNGVGMISVGYSFN